MEPKKKFKKMTHKEEKVLFDQDWQTDLNKVDPNIFLEQIDCVSCSSASQHTSTFEGMYFEALMRIYLRSKSFSHLFDLKLDLPRTVKNVYECEELFVLQINFEINEFLIALNGGKFRDVFDLTYKDLYSGKFEKNDLLVVEIRHSLLSMDSNDAFRKFYDVEMIKIGKIFKYWGEKKCPPNFNNIHVFLFYNRERGESLFKEELQYSKREFDGLSRKIYFYFVFCEKKKIFFNMTGRESFSPSGMLGDFFSLKEEIEKISEENKQIQKEQKELKKKIAKSTIFEYE